MRESTKIRVQGVAVVCFIVGLMLFLNETRSTGEAPERFKLFISTSTVSIMGATLVLIALVMLAVVYALSRKKI